MAEDGLQKRQVVTYYNKPFRNENLREIIDFSFKDQHKGNTGYYKIWIKKQAKTSWIKIPRLFPNLLGLIDSILFPFGGRIKYCQGKTEF